MKERELGSMQVANDRIRIMERTPDKETPIEIHAKRIPFMNGQIPLLQENQGARILSEWWALVDEETVVGWGCLTDGDAIDTVVLWVSVAAQARRLGLGRLMIRFATDLAIRNRLRVIITEVEDSNEIALGILEDEDFEKQTAVHAGFTRMRKELKWA